MTVTAARCNFTSVQTTIQIDDALLAQAKKLAEEKGCDLSYLINETLRAKFVQNLPGSSPKILKLTTVTGEGVYPGVDLDNSAALLAVMEQGE